MGRQRVDVPPAARDALKLLGIQIRLARAERRMTAAELAERIGVSRHTVSSIEAGEPNVAIGNAFKAAHAVGIRLFGADDQELRRLGAQGEQLLTLVPSRVYSARSNSDTDDFAF